MVRNSTVMVTFRGLGMFSQLQYRQGGPARKSALMIRWLVNLLRTDGKGGDSVFVYPASDHTYCNL